jgi:hypothetical protein
MAIGNWFRDRRAKGTLNVPTISEKNKSRSDSYFSMPLEQRASLHRMGNAPKYSDPNPPKAGEGMSQSNKHYISQQQFSSKPQKFGM